MRSFLRVLLVAAITGGILVAIGIVLIGKIGGPHPLHQRIKGDFQSIGSALRTYKIYAGHYPSTEQGLKALVERPTIPPLPDDWVQTMTKVPTDPWRNEYRYRCFPESSPHPFELISNGPDGIEGTQDDRSSLHQSNPNSKP